MVKPGMFISDRYEIIDKVGSGGMADVYKARCHRLNRFVAIKILKPEYSSDKSFVNKFRGEAQSAAGLSHPNIVSVYDVGDDDGLHYIVMELVEGITLKRFIERKGKLEVKEAVGITIQIAQGMEAAHSNHIIHRDIKPQNIMISRDGKVKVADFGIAKAATSNTITSNAMGSVHYLSPEQARGGYSDEKSDIYSLGVTLYEMISGKLPFAGDNTVSVALLHIQGEAIPLRELDPNVPISIDKIVQKCMQKKPERRYLSASEMILDLKKSIANPNGDFVQLSPLLVSDSPTINIAEDLAKIKNGALIDSSLPLKKKEKGSMNLMDDEEELDTVDSRVEKIFLIGSIAAVIILGIVILFLVINFLISPGKKDAGESGTPTEAVTPSISPDLTITPVLTPIGGIVTFIIPDVVGYIEEDAKTSIKAKYDDAQIQTKQEFSDLFEKGMVTKQYPAAGNDVMSDTIIILTISTGPEPFEVPNVYNITEEQAIKKLVDLDLDPNRDYASSDVVDEGRVISTMPEHLSMITKGSPITIMISTGPENAQVVVPSLIGLTEQAAIDSLSSKGLTLGTISNEASDTYDEGQITYQSYSSGQKVDAGAQIDVTISTGSGSTTDPNKTYKYIGEVTISTNPFETLGIDEGEVVVKFEQDGSVWEQNMGVLSGADFPLSVKDIDGDSDSMGIATMDVNGVPFKLNNDTEPATWTITFIAVEE